MARAFDTSTSFATLQPRSSPSPATTDTASYVKFTPAVERGVKYLIAAGEFDSSHELVRDGQPVEMSISNDDVAAATRWLRYVLKHKTGAS